MKKLFILFFIFSTNFCIGSIKSAPSLQGSNKKHESIKYSTTYKKAT